ncbi:MAG: hypothetical protein JW709_07350 [Sedimentisphaerales bacterium]|nr:hypothetical protein [Sedimentisphaerales bacterium]
MRHVLILVVFLWLVGCAAHDIAQQDANGLIMSFGQADQADSRRLKVLDELLTRQLTIQQQESLGRTLSEVLASQCHSPIIRARAANLVMEYYPEEAPIWLAKGLDATSPGELRSDFITKIIQLDDPRPIPQLIVLLADEANDINLAETSAGRGVEQLSRRSLLDCCREVFIGNYPLREKMAGLNCLVRLEGYDQILQEAGNWPEEGFIVAEVRFWARYFGYLPTNVPRLLMGRVQRDRLSPEQFNLLQMRSKFLREQYDYRFDVRDSYLLVTLDESDFQTTRALLTKDITDRLAALSHTKRPAGYPGSIDDYPESFADQAERLSILDLLRIRLLLDTLTLSHVRQDIYDLLRLDIHDINSEAGGLCLLNSGKQVEFRPYAPGGQKGDKHYIESAALLTDAALCLARWHAHVDPFRGREIAGPGPDDLLYARIVNTPVVIITLLENDRLNVDYLAPDGWVIDLGNYQ